MVTVKDILSFALLLHVFLCMVHRASAPMTASDENPANIKEEEEKKSCASQKEKTVLEVKMLNKRSYFRSKMANMTDLIKGLPYNSLTMCTTACDAVLCSGFILEKGEKAAACKLYDTVTDVGRRLEASEIAGETGKPKYFVALTKKTDRAPPEQCWATEGEHSAFFNEFVVPILPQTPTPPLAATTTTSENATVPTVAAHPPTTNQSTKAEPAVTVTSSIGSAPNSTTTVTRVIPDNSTTNNTTTRNATVPTSTHPVPDKSSSISFKDFVMSTSPSTVSRVQTTSTTRATTTTSTVNGGESTGTTKMNGNLTGLTNTTVQQTSSSQTSTGKQEHNVTHSTTQMDTTSKDETTIETTQQMSSSSVTDPPITSFETSPHSSESTVDSTSVTTTQPPRDYGLAGYLQLQGIKMDIHIGKTEDWQGQGTGDLIVMGGCTVKTVLKGGDSETFNNKAESGSNIYSNVDLNKIKSVIADCQIDSRLHDNPNGY